MKNVSAALFLRNGKVLIAKRGAGKHLTGYWEFPGGKQEPGENIFECLEREIREELHVACKARKIFCENIHRYDTGEIKLTAILADLPDNRIELSEHQEYRWVDITELLNYNLSPADIPIAERLIGKQTAI